MWADDRASQALGMSIDGSGPARATLPMTVRPGHGERPRHRARRPHVHAGRLARSPSPATPTTGARWPPAPRSGSARPPGSATCWSPPPSSGSREGRDGVYDVTVTAGDDRRRRRSSGGAGRSAAPSVRPGGGARRTDMTGEIPTPDPRGARGAPARAAARHAAPRRTRNVPHYRRAFDEAGVTPGRPAHASPTWPASRSPTKADLRENYPFGMFAVPREQVRRVHASSGTTGQADRGRLHRARTSTPGRS